MGPRLFSVEDHNANDPAYQSWQCFNGATLIQRGGRSFAASLDAVVLLASMGPRLFSVEDVGRHQSRSRRRNASMGPRLFSVEDNCKPEFRTDQHLLNGATLIQRGGLSSQSAESMTTVRASMGPRLFSVEDESIVSVKIVAEIGFNGATLIQRGGPPASQVLSSWAVAEAVARGRDCAW